MLLTACLPPRELALVLYYEVFRLKCAEVNKIWSKEERGLFTGNYGERVSPCY